MAGKFNLTQLLNDTSRATAEFSTERPEGRGIDKIVKISVYDLIPSKNNFYSTEQIEELKASIEMFGIKQNLTVCPVEGGKYEVIAGHRRRLASLALVEEGKPEYEFIPCAVEAERDEIRERLLLITTNSTARQLTDWEKVQQAEEIRRLLEEYKKREGLPGRIRDLIAEALNTSAAQIGRMDAISRNLVPEFKDEMQAGRVNLSTAYELSGLPEDEQRAAYEDYKERGAVTIKDAKAKKTPPPAADPPSPPTPSPLADGMHRGAQTDEKTPTPAEQPAPSGTTEAPEPPPPAFHTSSGTGTKPGEGAPNAIETRFQRFTKTPEHLAEILANSGFCTHYAGYTCDKGWPKACPACITSWLKKPYEE